MAQKGERATKKIVEQIADDKAIEVIGDLDFVKSRKLDRVFHVVRDRADPSIIVSMTVMEHAKL